MIPPSAAILAYVPLAALLMADRNAVRGFTLAFLGAMLLLPAGAEVQLPAIPDLEKDNAWIWGVALGTLVFHAEAVRRFRFLPSDLLILALVPVTIATSVLNGFGAYDGLSRAFEVLLNFGGVVFLARLHLAQPGALRCYLLALVFAAALYVPLAAYEFRMSPQIHQTLYGYFQHSFAQHRRGSFWRPVVCFPHALVLGRFFAFAAFLALFPMRGDLRRRFGQPGGYLFLLPLLGLLLSMSFGPMLLFALLALFFLLLPRHRWIGFLPPACAVVWLTLVLTGLRPGYGVVGLVEGFSPERAASLAYRLDALQEYRDIIVNRLWLGHGGWGHGRIAGRATDAQALVSFIDRGLVGSLLYFGWWAAAIGAAFRMVRRTEGAPFQPRVTAIAALGSLAMAIAAIDAALEYHLLVAAAALMAIDAAAPQRPLAHATPLPLPLRRLRAPHAAGAMGAP